MPESVSARCGFCGKEFRLRPGQLGRDVRCPHCKTICKILPQTQTAREAVEVLGPELQRGHPVTTHRHVVLPRGGVRHMSIAIVWVALLALGLAGLIVMGIVAWSHRRPGEAPLASAGRPPAAPYVGAPSPAPPATYARPGTGAGTTSGSPAPVATPAQTEPVTVEIERLVDGMNRGTQTYAVGTVTNPTRDTLRVVEVEVAVLDKEDRELGRAHARLRDLAPGETAPVVAVWEHDVSVIGAKYVAACVVGGETPAGPPHRLAIEGDAWPVADPGGFGDTGCVRVRVANRGEQAVEVVELTVIMRGADGTVVGAAREEVLSRVMPGQSGEMEIPYEHCPARRIRHIQVRAQPAEP